MTTTEEAERLEELIQTLEGAARGACDLDAWQWDAADMMRSLAEQRDQLRVRAEAAEAELAQIKAKYQPGHTDMMVSPERLDEWLAENPPPDELPETMFQRGAEALPYLWTDADRQHYARRVIYAALEVRPPAEKVYVHRDLGPGFTHTDSPDCACVPHLIEPDDQRTTDQILGGIQKKERGDA